MALSSQLQTTNIGDNNDNLDLLELIDWEQSNQSWFQEMSKDFDMKNVPTDNVPGEKITLVEL